MKFVLTAIVAFFLFVTSVFAQTEHTQFHPHHTLGFMISHTQVSQGIQSNGNKKWLSLPSWAINYNYKFSSKWAIGLHTDIVVEDFTVEEHLKSGGGQALQRSYPIASAVMLSYKLGKHFSLMGGAGGEFAHTGNLFLARVGLEYGYHLSNKWELNANITNDIKINAYNSWALGLGLTRVLN